jgi:hypothetical protein
MDLFLYHFSPGFPYHLLAKPSAAEDPDTGPAGLGHPSADMKSVPEAVFV